MVILTNRAQTEDKVMRFRRRLALLGLTLGLGVASLALGTVQAQAATTSQPTVQIAAASAVPVTTQGGAFHTASAFVQMGSLANPYLTGQANADGPLYVDDVLEISLCNPDTHLCTVIYTKDFSNNCTAAFPVSEWPIFLKSVLPTSGLQNLHFTLRDKCGGNEGSSNIYLTGLGVISGDQTPPPDDHCSSHPLKYFNSTFFRPDYRASAYAPFVGADHSIHGVGVVNVTAKLNCSAQVRIRLETKVCGHFRCNPKTIDSSGWDILPAAGRYTRELRGNCRKGVDSYRVQIQVLWAQWDGAELVKGKWVPNANRYSEAVNDGDTGWVKLTC
jgi:hypothetical protein